MSRRPPVFVAPTTLDELDDYIDRFEDPPATMAEQLETAATAAGPDDQVSPAELLVAAAEFWGLADQPDRQLDACRRAVASSTPCRIDPRGYLAAALLRSGSADQARATLAALRPGKLGQESLLYVGEVHEELDDLDPAHTCFTRGAVLAQRGVGELSMAIFALARLRVRDALGYPHDDFDQAAIGFQMRTVRRLDELAHPATVRGTQSVVPDVTTYVDLFE